eukprot:6821523-Pyramimonas_sp.AAC.1
MRPLTKEERRAQLQRKAEKQARKEARQTMERELAQEVPFEPPKRVHKVKPPSTRAATPSASSGSGAMTELGQLASAMQANTETLGKMATAIERLANSRSN